jgi:hypothetical protein
VPGRASRVARGEGDEAGAALRARGARASIARGTIQRRCGHSEAQACPHYALISRGARD